MASIFTGLAFMHGHIVNRELALRLGRAEPVATKSGGRKARPVQPADKPPVGKAAMACAPGCC